MMKKFLLASAVLMLSCSAMAHERVVRPASLPPQQTTSRDAAQMVFRYNDLPEEAFSIPQATPGVSVVYAQ